MAHFIVEHWLVWLILAVVTIDYAMFFNLQMGSSMLGSSGGITLLQAIASIPLLAVRLLQFAMEKAHFALMAIAGAVRSDAPRRALVTAVFTAAFLAPVVASLLAAAGVYLKFFAG